MYDILEKKEDTNSRSCKYSSKNEKLYDCWRNLDKTKKRNTVVQKKKTNLNKLLMICSILLILML